MTESDHDIAVQERGRDIVRIAVLPIVLSVVIGVGTALVDTPVALGIIGALLVGVIAVLVHLVISLQRTDADAQATLHELLPITHAKRLDRATGDYLLALATAQTTFLTTARKLPVFDLELEHQREILLAQYAESANGRIVVNLKASPVLRETDGVSSVNKTLNATSVVQPHTYWDVPSGLSYLEQQQAMLDDDVVIRRIFIYRRADLPDLKQVMQTHLAWRKSYGPQKLDMRVTLIDDSLDSDLVVDFAIVDGTTVVGLETHHGIAQPTAIVWEADESAVATARRRFKRLWAAGIDPDELAEFKAE
jgi:hypothetical protein